MFRLFPRPRANDPFKARSPERHIEVDRLRAEAVFHVIEDVLQAARVEQAGLTARVDEILARAAITLGNDTDENSAPRQVSRFRSGQDIDRRNCAGDELSSA